MDVYLKNVFRLFTKHYVENWSKYLGAALVVFAVPLLFAYLSDNAVMSITMGLVIWVACMAYVLHVSWHELRSRYTYIMSSVLPVSAAERYGFIVLNSTVVLAIWYLIIHFITVKLSMALFPIDEDFMWAIEDNFLTNSNSIVGLIGTHAVLLVVNLNYSKRLIVNYFYALLAIMAYQWMLSTYVDVADRECFKLWSNIVVALVSWTAGYFLVRKYQYKG